MTVQQNRANIVYVDLLFDLLSAVQRKASSQISSGMIRDLYAVIVDQFSPVGLDCEVRFVSTGKMSRNLLRTRNVFTYAHFKRTLLL